MKASIKTRALVIGAAMVLCGGGCINMSESNVSTGTNRGIVVSYRRRTRKARIDHNQLRAVVNFGFHRPAEPDRVSFSGVTAHHHDEVGVLDVDPVVGHRTATKCWSKT